MTIFVIATGNSLSRQFDLSSCRSPHVNMDILEIAEIVRSVRINRINDALPTHSSPVSSNRTIEVKELVSTCPAGDTEVSIVRLVTIAEDSHYIVLSLFRSSRSCGRLRFVFRRSNSAIIGVNSNGGEIETTFALFVLNDFDSGDCALRCVGYILKYLVTSRKRERNTIHGETFVTFFVSIFGSTEDDFLHVHVFERERKFANSGRSTEFEVRMDFLFTLGVNTAEVHFFNQEFSVSIDVSHAGFIKETCQLSFSLSLVTICFVKVVELQGVRLSHDATCEEHGSEKRKNLFHKH